jgi:hypothetical protein
LNIFTRISNVLKDPLATFRIFERTIGVVCMTIPALLRLADKGNTGFRESISDYVYMSDSYIYGMLLCMAAMLFVFNGAVYFRNSSALGLQRAGSWYNVILGVSLLGIILFPDHQYVIVHYFFAGVFFLGNAVVIGFFHNTRDRVISIVLAVVTVAAIALHYIGVWSLLVGEWVSLAVIAAHFIMQARGPLTPSGGS